jgi:hypothetical protein
LTYQNNKKKTKRNFFKVRKNLNFNKKKKQVESALFVSLKSLLPLFSSSFFFCKPCAWNKVDWRKLMFLGVVMTIVGIMVSAFAFPHTVNARGGSSIHL